MRSRYSVSVRIGNIQAGETDSLFLPGENARGATKYGVLLLHGATAPQAFQDTTRWASAQIGGRIAEAGIPCLAGQMGGDTFANDTAMTRIGQARTYLAAASGCSNAKILLVGASMGAALALRYAGENPAQVAGVVGIIPLVNIDAIYQANTLGLRAAIGTAWGVVYPAALPANANLTVKAAPMADGVVPSILYYSDADAAINPADVIAMANTIDAELVEHDPTNLGHTEGGINNIGTYGDGNWSHMVEWLKDHGA
jgi:pimeloyl-ACP methyl ester carboxylesterase